ncbi:helix-turn-helix transcriptional regulator [Mucilaginibacter endophyticus]|uniref:helix-turn-helix transcriptional regulator n=1 Tax=Mucilaginibacter endophyticus TaxID=2675003 RepID=UPI000E0DF8B1|nr:helix-turn-helix domain-containing protein [Mucilaginibacter endophyticus]
MQIINQEALSLCIRQAVRAELQEHFETGGSQLPNSEKLLSKQELAAELGVSLVTLTDWMKKGLPYLRLHKRVYFRKSEVLNAMQQTIND